jgi:hypothetical protein
MIGVHSAQGMMCACLFFIERERAAMIGLHFMQEMMLVCLLALVMILAGCLLYIGIVWLAVIATRRRLPKVTLSRPEPIPQLLLPRSTLMFARSSGISRASSTRP